MVHRYTLPGTQLQSSFSLGLRPDRIHLNCTGTKAAVLVSQVLKFFQFKEHGASQLKYERKDVWDFKWDSVSDF